MASRNALLGVVACISLLVLPAAWVPASAQERAAPIEQVKVRAIAHFDFDRDTLKDQDQAHILGEVGQMKDVSWKNVVAVGHTDSVGPTPYNDELSERRAAAVRAYLVGKGLSPQMIKTAGKGADAPVADNESAAGRAQNRRVEIEFQGVRTKAN